MTPLYSALPWNHACWYVLHTHGLQEIRVEKNLNAWGVETFNPKMREFHSHAALNKSTYKVKSLFPSYIFAHFNAYLMQHKIRFTRGVRSIVSSNGSPVPVAQEIIDFLKSRLEEDGFVRFQRFAGGDKVMIVKGPLTDLCGVFEKGLNDSERVVILLTTVNYQSHIVIEKDFLRKVS
jgi:transcription antitermination factor NusG